MGDIDPNLGWGVLIILMILANLIMNIVRTMHSIKRKPSVGEDLGSINTRIDALASDLEETKARFCRLEDKISSRIEKLHLRINDVFGELREISGTIKSHMENK